MFSAPEARRCRIAEVTGWAGLVSSRWRAARLAPPMVPPVRVLVNNEGDLSTSLAAAAPLLADTLFLAIDIGLGRRKEGGGRLTLLAAARRARRVAVGGFGVRIARRAGGDGLKTAAWSGFGDFDGGKAHAAWLEQRWGGVQGNGAALAGGEALAGRGRG